MADGLGLVLENLLTDFGHASSFTRFDAGLSQCKPNHPWFLVGVVLNSNAIFSTFRVVMNASALPDPREVNYDQLLA